MKVDLNEVSYIGETSVTIRSSRRRITIPKEVVEQMNIRDGDKVRWIIFNDGRLVLSRVPSSTAVELDDESKAGRE